MGRKNSGGTMRDIKYLLILFVACLVFYMSYSYAFLSKNPALSKEDAEEIAESELVERGDENESEQTRRR